MLDSNELRHELRLPLIAALIFLISSPEPVIAACRASYVGAFPTPNCQTVDGPDALEESGLKPDFSSEGRKKRAWKNIWSDGQGAGVVDPVADIVDSYDHDCRAAILGLADGSIHTSPLSAAG